MKKIIMLSFICLLLLSSCLWNNNASPEESIAPQLEENITESNQKVDDEVFTGKAIWDYENIKKQDTQIINPETYENEVPPSSSGNILHIEEENDKSITYWLRQYYPSWDIKNSRILYEEDGYVVGDFIYTDWENKKQIDYFWGIKKKDKYFIQKDVSITSKCNIFKKFPDNLKPDCLDKDYNIVLTKNISSFYNGMDLEDRRIAQKVLQNEEWIAYDWKKYCHIKSIGENYIDASCGTVWYMWWFRRIIWKKDNKWWLIFEWHDTEGPPWWNFEIEELGTWSYKQIFSFTKFQD